VEPLVGSLTPLKPPEELFNPPVDPFGPLGELFKSPSKLFHLPGELFNPLVELFSPPGALRDPTLGEFFNPPFELCNPTPGVLFNPPVELFSPLGELCKPPPGQLFNPPFELFDLPEEILPRFFPEAMLRERVDELKIEKTTGFFYIIIHLEEEGFIEQLCLKCIMKKTFICECGLFGIFSTFGKFVVLIRLLGQIL